MRGSALFAWRYLAHHPVRTASIVVGLALTLFLPLSIEWLVASYGAALRARAESTPLVLGAPGSRYDLVLDALHFRGRTPTQLSMAAVDDLGADALATPIPLFTRLTAHGYPLVGTGHEYYGFRGLVAAAGSLPLRLGDCVVGARVARELGLAPGDSLLTDRESLYDLARGYPLKMHVAGVLAPREAADDGAVFCDLRTAWLAAGIGHGHRDAEGTDESGVLRRDADGQIVLNASIVEYTEVTPENAASFHFHGERASLPVTAVIAVPRDARARTLLKGRYRVRTDAQLLEPAEVMGELLGLVFRVKVFFDANTALVLVAAALFLAVIVTLSLAVRARERRTLFRIGCSRATVVRLMAAELGFVLAGALALAAVLATLLVQVLSRNLLQA